MVCCASSVEQLSRRVSAAQDDGLIHDARGYLPAWARTLPGDRRCVGEVLVFSLLLQEYSCPSSHIKLPG